MRSPRATLARCSASLEARAARWVRRRQGEDRLPVELGRRRLYILPTRAGVGFVPQGREIFARLTVLENLQMGLAYKPGGTPIPAELFELFPVLKQMLGRRGGDLSGGQQQQLAIARALAAGPKLLILDEPTEGIQPNIIKDIGKVIRMLADRGDMAIVLVEQYYDFAEALADQYVVMERGEVIASGPGSEMAAKGVRQLVAI